MAIKSRVVYREGGPMDGESFEYEGELIEEGYIQLTPFPGDGVYAWRGDKKPNGDRILQWVEDGNESG